MPETGTSCRQLLANERDEAANVPERLNIPRAELDLESLLGRHDQRHVGQRIPAVHVSSGHLVEDRDRGIVEDISKDTGKPVAEVGVGHERSPTSFATESITSIRTGLSRYSATATSNSDAP